MTPLLLALLSGALFAFSLPPWNWEGLGWLAFAPLLVGVQGRRPLEAVGMGMLAGLVCGVIQAGWSPDSQRLFWAFIPFLWLTFLFGGVALAAAKFPRQGNGLLWVAFIACAGVSGEWLTSFLPLPLNIALCQYRVLPLIQIASLTGIWGVSFLLWFSNAALADAWLQKRGRTRPVAVAFALVALSLGFGLWRLRPAPENRPYLTVAAVQDLTREEVGGLAASPKGAADREAMTRQAAARGAQLVVWSEESLGNDFAPDDPKDATRKLARQFHTSLVVGYSDDARPKAHNCAAFIDQTGVVQGVHHKIHLYPGENQTIQAGQRDRAFPTALGRVGLEVCFDSCYTDVTRHLVLSRAQIIAMPNYDPPTPTACRRLSMRGAASSPNRLCTRRTR